MKVSEFILGLLKEETNKNSKNYYTTSYPITIKDFIKIEVRQRGNYDISDVNEWIEKYNITKNDKLIWVALNPHTAARYQMLAQDWDNAEEIYNKNPEEYDVEVIDSKEGFLIPETNDGDEGFIFVYRKDLREEISDDTYSSYKGLKPYKQRISELLNSIKTFNDIDEEKINGLIDHFGYQGFNSKEEGLEYLKDKIEEYKKLPNQITLYRVIGVEDKKMIDTNDLGQHYTPYENEINIDLLDSIGYENWGGNVKPYVLKVSALKNQIDVIQTIIQNLSFPNENEINLKDNGRGVNVLKVYKLKGF